MTFNCDLSNNILTALIFIFCKSYFKFAVNYVNYAIVKSIVWQLEAWEAISGELKRWFQRPKE